MYLQVGFRLWRKVSKRQFEQRLLGLVVLIGKVADTRNESSFACSYSIIIQIGGHCLFTNLSVQMTGATILHYKVNKYFIQYEVSADRHLKQDFERVGSCVLIDLV
jgi:hypothetical protein